MTNGGIPLSEVVDIAALVPDRGAGLWRDHHPLERATLLGGLLFGVLLTTSALIGATALCVTTALALTAGAMPPARWVRGLLVPLAFIVPAMLVLAIQFGDASGVLPGSISISRSGLEVGGSIALRTLACVSCTLLFIHTTPLHVVVLALRRGGVPAGVTDTLLITARLVELLGARLVALSRTLLQRHGTNSWRARLRSVSLIGATLLVDAIERSARLERGIAGRGGLGADVMARPAWRALDRGRMWRSAVTPMVVLSVGAVASRWLSGVGLPW
jgi:cobalt/nickel transport system permease protein